jgi:transposase InsO family protein
VLITFTKAAGQHGYPASTLTDNGMVYTVRFAGGKGGNSKLEHELRRLGITQKNSRPGHPTTCGKVERFHVVPPESWRASLCGFPVGGRAVLVADRAHHARRAVPALVVVEPVAPVQHDGLGLAGATELVA